MEVGQRIRRLRTEAGVSLADLAATSGLGKGTLSELERGQRNPTLDTLFSVATALEVPLSDVMFDNAVFSEPKGGAHPSPARGRSVVADLLDRWSDDDGVCEVYRVTLDEHTQHSKPHMAGVIETLTVISGAAEVGLTTAPALISAGQSHTFAGDAPHIYRGANGHATGVLVMYYPT